MRKSWHTFSHHTSTTIPCPIYIEVCQLCFMLFWTQSFPIADSISTDLKRPSNRFLGPSDLTRKPPNKTKLLLPPWLTDFYIYILHICSPDSREKCANALLLTFLSSWPNWFKADHPTGSSIHLTSPKNSTLLLPAWLKTEDCVKVVHQKGFWTRVFIYTWLETIFFWRTYLMLTNK